MLGTGKTGGNGARGDAAAEPAVRRGNAFPCLTNVLIPDKLGPARRAVHLFVRPNIRRVSLTFVLSLAVATAAASEPLLLKLVVDRLAGATPQAADSTLHALVTGVALFALVLTCRILGAAWVTTSTWAVRLNLEYQLRSRVAAKGTHRVMG